MTSPIGIATLCGFRRGRGAKTVVFFTFLDLRGQPSAGFGVVAVLKPSFFYVSFCARTTLCGFHRGRGAKTVVFLRFLICADNPLRLIAGSRC